MKVNDLIRQLGVLLKVDPSYGEHEIYAVLLGGNDDDYTDGSNKDFAVEGMYQSYGGISLLLAEAPVPSPEEKVDDNPWDHMVKYESMEDVMRGL